MSETHPSTDIVQSRGPSGATFDLTRSQNHHRAPTSTAGRDSHAMSQGGEKKGADDGYLPMNWIEDGGKKTRDMLQHIKEDVVLRKLLYPGQGEETTSMTATKCHQQIAEYLLKDDARYAHVWPRLRVKYGLAVKSRLHKLYEGYVHKRAVLNNSGAGLSDADRAKFPLVNNLPELVRKLFIWYDEMDALCHERAVVGLDSLTNSDDVADLSVLGVTRNKRSSPPDPSGQTEATTVARIEVDDDVCSDEEAGKRAKSNNDKPGGKSTNVARSRGTRAAPVDLGPIGEAIREGDEKREQTKRERLATLEKTKTLEFESRERRAAAELAYKLERDKIRGQVAQAKLAAEIRLKELEIERINAGIRHQELYLRGAQQPGPSAANPVADSSAIGRTSDMAEQAQQGTSVAHLLL